MSSPIFGSTGSLFGEAATMPVMAAGKTSRADGLWNLHLERLGVHGAQVLPWLRRDAALARATKKLMSSAGPASRTAGSWSFHRGCH